MTFTVHVDETFVREELRFSVRAVEELKGQRWGTPGRERRPNRFQALLDTLAATERPAIVYTMSRADTVWIAESLTRELDAAVLPYHADLNADVKRDVERRFLSGDVDCIVATSAFGMGIDKDDIRTVIHWQVPPTPEALYQEAGRAGRGPRGRPAQAVLLFDESDLSQSYRLLREGVPTRDEVRRTDQALRLVMDLQQRPVVRVTDSDLKALAALRSEVPERVVIAHLERAGLITELDRTYGARSLRRTASAPGGLTALESDILGLLAPDGACCAVEATEVIDLGHASSNREVWAAVDGLQRRGIVSRCRNVSFRPLDADTGLAIQAVRTATNSVWSQLAAHHREHGANRYFRSVSIEQGDLDAIRKAVEVLSAFGLADVKHEDADGRLPAIRRRQAGKLEDLQGAFQRAEQVAAFATGLGILDSIPLDTFADRCGLGERQVLDGLMLLHLVEAAAVDLRSWEMQGSSVTREIEVIEVPDRDERLEAAIEASKARARMALLRLEALRRYALVEPGDDDDADPHQAFLERYLTEPDFLEQIAADSTEELLDSLTPDQCDAVTARASEPVVIVAGPGTGKTRTLVSRIAYRVRAGYVLPERVLAITFTRAATEEVKARMAQLGVRGTDVRTLDSLAWRIVRQNWRTLGFNALPSLVDSQHEIFRAIDPDANADSRVRALNLQKSRRLALVDRDHLDYQQHLTTENLLDFNDVKAIAIKFLVTDQRAGHYLTALDEVYVDEFQDLSPLQIDLVDAISSLAHLTIVGDPRQAIYEWNGASPEELVRRSSQPGTSFNLTRSFRSTPEILRVANNVIRNVMPSLPGMAPSTGTNGPPIVWGQLENDADMIELVVVAVREWLEQGIPDNEIAVLAYKGSRVNELGRALRAASIPAREVGLPVLSSTQAFQVFERALQTLDSTDEDESLLDQLDRIRGLPELEQGLHGSTDDETANNFDDWERLRAAVDDLRRNGTAGSLAEAAGAIRRAKDGPSSRVGVTVTTMSKAKGLEWEAVAVTDLGADAMADWSNDPERCRLAYVAVTRAKTYLDLSWVGVRTKWLA